MWREGERRGERTARALRPAERGGARSRRRRGLERDWSKAEEEWDLGRRTKGARWDDVWRGVGVQDHAKKVQSK